MYISTTNMSEQIVQTCQIMADHVWTISLQLMGVSLNPVVDCFLCLQLIGQKICATMVMGEELHGANHYAAELIKDITGDLSGQWENFCRLLQERVGLLEHSVNFQEKLQTVCKICFCNFCLGLFVSTVKFNYAVPTLYCKFNFSSFYDS